MSTSPSNNMPESGNSYTPPPVANYGTAETPAPAAPYSAAPLNTQFPDAAPAPAAPKSKVRMVLSALGILLVVGIFGWRAYVSYTENAALKEGQCIVIDAKSANDAEHKAADCSDTKTYSYYIGQVVDGKGECSDDSIEYTLSSSKKSNSKVVKTTCLIPNFNKDVCYKTVDANIAKFAVVACSEAEFKVAQVLDSATAQCAENEKAIPFTKPARTYCIADPTS